MDYFTRDLFTGNARFWVAMIFFGLWGGATIDFITGVFKGLWFLIALILTALALALYFGIPALKGLRKKRENKIVELHAVPFEAEQEKEFRKILEQHPEFTTHCYECIYFNSRLLHCSRKLSGKASRQRVREVDIKGKKYCLYWTPPPLDAS